MAAVVLEEGGDSGVGFGLGTFLVGQRDADGRWGGVGVGGDGVVGEAGLGIGGAAGIDRIGQECDRGCECCG